jgi:energy-coupling factor transporter transmembrane protein EcfT
LKPKTPLLPLGIAGQVALLSGVLALVMLASRPLLPAVAALCILLTLAGFQPPEPRRLLHPRRLLLLLLLALPPLFLLGPRNAHWHRLHYSATGAATAMQIALRFTVVMLAVEGFTRTLSISELAGFLERLGLRGLGFSLGVALNLLPALQNSSQTTWHALQMRGGLRKQKRRALSYLVITILSNTLRRAEAIALAAEARAFTPQRARAWPITRRPLDKWLAASLLAALLTLLIYQ